MNLLASTASGSQKLVISGSLEVIKSLAAVIPQAEFDAQSYEPDALGLEWLSAIIVTRKHIEGAIKKMYTALRPFIDAHPEMTVEIEGKAGKIKLAMKNVTEKTIADALDRAIRESRSLRKLK